MDRKAVKEDLEALGKEATTWLASETIAAGNRRIRYQMDLRYHRQGYEFPIDVELGWLDKADGFDRVVERFKDVHQQNYGFNIEHLIEVVNLRAVAVGIVPKVELEKKKRTTPAKPRPSERHTVYYRGKTVDAPIYDRYALQAGDRISGAAVITQNDSTTLILPGHVGVVDDYLNILIWPASDPRARGKSTATGTSRTKASARRASGRK
jgi:N-methylhydantoinase A